MTKKWLCLLLMLALLPLFSITALAADAEVLHAALGLGAPVAVRRDRDLAHGVVFDAGIHR